jgi:hypothetical protein
MSAIFKKLNLKDEKEITVLNAPDSFKPELASLGSVKVVHDLAKSKEIHFVLAFVIKQAEVDAISLAVAPKAKGDSLIWFAYPKGTSKKYKCEFNRDNGWAVLNGLGWRGIRMVAIDEDWSALRFRRMEYIKSK